MDIFDDLKNDAELSEVGVHAGFPNPAAERDHRRAKLSLDDLLVPRPTNTYFFRAEGHGYADQGIMDGDIVVIDRSLKPRAYDLVLAWEDGFTIRPYGRLSSGTSAWGVITTVIHQFRSAT